MAGVLAAAAFVLAASASAQPGYHGDSAVTLYNRAQAGDARAAFRLGQRYASRLGGLQDDNEALEWFRKAAEAGLAEAQYNLGVMYATGRGVERSYAEAVRWYRLAAEQDVPEAQFNLGTLHGLGLGVPRDERLAAEWLRRAADHELPQAQYNLGVLYEHGRGVRLDARAARVWYRRAAARGYPAARERLAALEERLDSAAAEPPAPPPAVVVEESAAGAKIAAPTPGRAAPAPAAPGIDIAIDERWVRDRAADGYTVQVLSDSDEARVRRYVERNFDPGEAGYFPYRRGDATWYGVLYGDFPTYGAAKRALAALPEPLKAAKPWVRPFSSVRKLIRR